MDLSISCVFILFVDGISWHDAIIKRCQEGRKLKVIAHISRNRIILRISAPKFIRIDTADIVAITTFC